MSKRIAVAGFQHETNTFAPMGAAYEDFLRADAWPGLLRGDEVISNTEGINLPIHGFLRGARSAGDITIHPLLWCAAEPSSYVTNDAFERIAGEICDGVAALGAIDGIYLDLHGAMVTESFEDGEGELLARLRRRVGPDLPIVISLDLHANLTRSMVEAASAIAIYRTYPHLDMAETGSRAFGLMRRLFERGPLLAAWRQGPFLIPLPQQHTKEAPCRDLYAALPELEAATGAAVVELAMGFPLADIHDAGPTLVAYAETETAAEAAAAGLFERLCAAGPEFRDDLLSPAEAVKAAMADPGPVVIADVQDNPGAGGSSDTTGLLEALIEAGAQEAVLALLNDPEVAAEASRRGVGARFETLLGGKSGQAGQRPYPASLQVEALSDGRFPFEGEMYAGAVADIGSAALLRVAPAGTDPAASGVRVVVGSIRCQCLDRAIFRHIGVEPEAQRILAVKSTVHFRADFEPIAARILTAEAPGAAPCRPERLSFRRLRQGVRRTPSRMI